MGLNRHQRRAARIKDPKGNWLEPKLLRIIERDAKGRPMLVRIMHDDETVEDVGFKAGEKNEALLVWMLPGQGAVS